MGLSDWVPDSSDEADTDRDGFLSTRREVHALAMGLVVGGVTAQTTAWELGALFVAAALGVKLGGVKSEALAELQAEPWYALGGFGAAALAVVLATA